MIPYGRQHIGPEDEQAVLEVLRSAFLTQGPLVGTFETAVAQRCGAAHAVAVNSGTSALHVAYRALGLGAGDLLLTSPLTFVATANTALLCGAEVEFVDMDPATLGISIPALRDKLERLTAQGRRPKIVVPVHMAGHPSGLAALKEQSEQHGFRIVEDASHALGATYRGQPVGDCHYSDIAVFSFHPVKIMTTGEGGMALTNDAELARRMAALRTHGVIRDRDRFERPDEGPWYYEQHDLGYNYRMTDIQAALGLSQLTRLDAFLARRRAIADRYDELLAGLPLILPTREADSVSSWHLYVVQLAEEVEDQRRRIFEGLRDQGIGVQVHYIPVHLQPYYRALGFSSGDFPAAERYYGRCFSLPIFYALTDDEQVRVCQILKSLLASR